MVSSDRQHGELVVGGNAQESVVIFDSGASEVEAVLKVRGIDCPFGSNLDMIFLHALES